MTANRTPIKVSLVPLQIVKTVFGIASPRNGSSQLVFCEDDLTLHAMDAPEVLPSGSAKSFGSLCDVDFNRESFCLRDQITPFQNF
jgi:hypothetical protein